MKKNNKSALLKIAVCFIFMFSFSFCVQAIELSMSENLGDIGTIGFVDMDKVFENLPQTKKSKEELETELSKKQKQIDKRKKDVASLKAKLIKLKEERLLLTAYHKDDDTDLSVSASAPLPLPDYDASLNYKPQNPPNTSATVKTEVYQKPPLIAPIEKLQIKIKNTEEELYQKQKELESFLGKIKKSFSDLEKIKKQKILADIYKAVEQVAIKEHISVVVRKKDVLFGQKMVDLTDKVLGYINN